MKKTLTAATIVSGLMAGVAYADDPSDHLIKQEPVLVYNESQKDATIAQMDREIAVLEQQLLVRKARRIFPDGATFMILDGQPKTIFVTGQDWKGISDTLKTDSRLREYLDPKSGGK